MVDVAPGLFSSTRKWGHTGNSAPTAGPCDLHPRWLNKKTQGGDIRGLIVIHAGLGLGGTDRTCVGGVAGGGQEGFSKGMGGGGPPFGGCFPLWWFVS